MRPRQSCVRAFGALFFEPALHRAALALVRAVERDAARVRELDRAQLLPGGSIRIYTEMMQILDRGIGEVIDEVRRSGDGANTLVLFTSDNGGERSSKIWPFVGRKFDLLEGGVRVPQIAWWPGRIAPARVTDQVCITMDLTATCLEAAEVAPTALSVGWRQPVASDDKPSAPLGSYALLAHGQSRPTRVAPGQLEIS